MTYWPIVTGFESRVTKIFVDLLKDEFDVTVITRHIAKRHTRSISEELDDNVRVIRIPFIDFRGRSYLMRILTIFSFSFASIIAIKYVKRGSIIITRGPPEVPYFAIIAQVIKYLKKVVWIGVVTDMIPDVAFEEEIVKSRPLKKLIASFCAWGYRKADHIIAITESLWNRLTEYGVSEEKMTLIGTPVDKEMFKPKPLTDDYAIELSSKADRFFVLYSGSFGFMYDFDPLLEAARSIQEISRDIFFIVRGDGDQKMHISKKISELGLTNMVLLGPVSEPDRIISFINISSVCVIPIKDSKSIDMTHPSKMFEFLACYKPVICSTRGETAKLIRKWNIGIPIPPRDPNAMKEAILYLYNNRQVCQKMGKNGRWLVVKEFSYEHLKQEMVVLVNKYRYIRQAT